VNFSPQQFDEACKDYAANWAALDETLYALCKRHPDHSTAASIKAKLWIIGRTYATGIERKVPSDGSQGGSLAKLSEHLLAHRKPMEAIFRRLRGICGPLDPDKLKRILILHGRMNELLRPILRRGGFRRGGRGTSRG